MRSVFFYSPTEQTVPPETGWRWWLKVWMPVALAVGIICIESTSLFSASHTSGWLRPILQRWFGPISDGTWDTFHHYLRKTGHFVGYGTIGLTFLRAWLYTFYRRLRSSLFVWRVRSSGLAILCTAIVAAGDELHQTTLPDRTGNATDVLLDTTGAFIFCFLIWLICWSGRTREPR